MNIMCHSIRRCADVSNYDSTLLKKKKTTKWSLSNTKKIRKTEFCLRCMKRKCTASKEKFLVDMTRQSSEDLKLSSFFDLRILKYSERYSVTHTSKFHIYSEKSFRIIFYCMSWSRKKYKNAMLNFETN